MRVATTWTAKRPTNMLLQYRCPKKKQSDFAKHATANKLFKSMLKGISEKRIIFGPVESARKIDGKEAARKTGYSNRPGSREIKGNQNS